MVNKEQCYQLAQQHNVQIDLHQNAGVIEYQLNLPEGYQLDAFDDRTGLVAMAENKKQLWKSISADLQLLISGKAEWCLIK